jgi:hypothetical protein
LVQKSWWKVNYINYGLIITKKVKYCYFNSIFEIMETFNYILMIFNQYFTKILKKRKKNDEKQKVISKYINHQTKNFISKNFVFHWIKLCFSKFNYYIISFIKNKVQIWRKVKSGDIWLKNYFLVSNLKVINNTNNSICQSNVKWVSKVHQSSQEYPK